MPHPNGRIPASALAPVYGGGRLLRAEAALFNHMSDEWVRRGHDRPAVNGTISGYRDLAGQVAMRRLWCGRGQCQNAAIPGQSNHGRGNAGDLNAAGIVAARDIGPAHGISKAWSDAPWEPWHHLILVDHADHVVLERIRRAAQPYRALSAKEARWARELRRQDTPRRRRTALRRGLARQRKALWRAAQRHGWTAARRERYALLVRLSAH